MKLNLLVVLCLLLCRTFGSNNLVQQVDVLNKPNHQPNKILYNYSTENWQILYLNTNDAGAPFFEYFSTYDAAENYLNFYGAGNQAKTVPDDSTGAYCFLTFGESPLIYKRCGELLRTDTIVYAKMVCDIGFLSGIEMFALVKASNDSIYLASTKDRVWQKMADQILIKADKKRSVQVFVDNIFMAVSLTGGFLLLLLWINKRSLEKQIIELKDLEKEKENSIFTMDDHPLGINDKDRLGFKHIEEAVINVMRNPETKPPLTIVISGKWGSGKSTLMNRIRQKLETDPETKGRFLTTWFNAWHLQGENNLLNTFLISMAKFYERSFMTFFRLKLFWIRFLKQSFFKQFLFWIALTVTLFIAVLLIYKVFILNIFGWKATLLDSYSHDILELIRGWGNFQNGAVGKPFFVLLNIIAGALSIFSFIFLRKELKPAGLNTFTELLNIQKFQMDSETHQPGHRQKFKEDFWDILQASDQTKKTVVFIDDIDRISGEKILELLEAINFISDTASSPADNSAQGTTAPRNSANMIFVLGMAAGEVACNLGKQLAKLNDSSRGVQELGLNYIEKMVQLIVSVPFDESNEDVILLTER